MYVIFYNIRKWCIVTLDFKFLNLKKEVGMFPHIKDLISEHPTGCLAPKETCSCTDEMRYKQEELQYWFSGGLSVISGIVGALIGNPYSTAVLTDCLHSFSDGFADWWSANIMRKIQNNPHDVDSLRSGGTHVIAIILFVAATWIIWEAWSRFSEVSYSVSPIWILIAGIITSGLDLTKIIVLSIAQCHNPNKLRAGLIWHALFDLRRSEIIIGIGVLSTVSMLLIPFELTKVFLFIDFAASFFLGLYMFYLSWLLWQNKHEHKHINIKPERWLIKKLTGYKIPDHHH
jgi:Co/Zn/Cd efflux system component